MDWENAIFAPGWLWSVVSTVVVVGSVLGLYRQLRLQSSQQAIEQLNQFEQEYTSERFLRYSLELLRAQKSGVDPADLPYAAGGPIIGYWERVGSLARRGHLDMDLLWEGGSGFYCQSDWVRLAPAIMKSRTDLQQSEVGLYFEWLSGQMEARARHKGLRLDDPASQLARLDQSIATHEAMIRVEESVRR